MASSSFRKGSTESRLTTIENCSGMLSFIIKLLESDELISDPIFTSFAHHCSLENTAFELSEFLQFFIQSKHGDALREEYGISSSLSSRIKALSKLLMSSPNGILEGHRSTITNILLNVESKYMKQFQADRPENQKKISRSSKMGYLSSALRESVGEGNRAILAAAGGLGADILSNRTEKPKSRPLSSLFSENEILEADEDNERVPDCSASDSVMSAAVAAVAAASNIQLSLVRRPQLEEDRRSIRSAVFTNPPSRANMLSQYESEVNPHVALGDGGSSSKSPSSGSADIAANITANNKIRREFATFGCGVMQVNLYLPEDKVLMVQDYIDAYLEVGYIVKICTQDGFLLQLRIRGDRLNDVIMELRALEVGVKFGIIDVLPIAWTSHPLHVPRSNTIMNRNRRKQQDESI